MAPHVGGKLFGVHLPIFNLILIFKKHQIFKILLILWEKLFIYKYT